MNDPQVYPCHRILWSQVTPMSSVMPSRLLSSVLPMMSFVWIKTDFNLMGEQGIDFGVLPIMMYFISIGFVLVLSLSSFLTGKSTIFNVFWPWISKVEHFFLTVGPNNFRNKIPLDVQLSFGKDAITLREEFQSICPTVKCLINIYIVVLCCC